MANTFTHVQQVPVTLSLKDWKGNPIEFEDAVIATDDPTVAVYENGILRGIAPSPEGVMNRLTATVDAKMGEGVEQVTAMAEFTVTLDPRPGAKILALELGDASDQ